MNRNLLHRLITMLISLVWLINGLYCKVLGLVPRHEAIVSRITGSEYSSELTILIGFAEILMAIWILIGYRQALCAILQIIVIAAMNAIEFILVPDLLLFGRANALNAIFLMVIIGLNTFTPRFKLRTA